MSGLKRATALLLTVALIGIAGVAWRVDRGADDEGGRTIVVRMLDDGGDLRFEPARIEAGPGDVIRFVQAGDMPHNVEFVKNGAPAGVDLGSAWVGRFLTSRGESYEIEIDERFADGEYDFICGPHAALGMTGQLVVRGAGSKLAAPPSPAAELPVVEGVRGARELAYERDGDTKVFRLTVERIRWETKEGELVEAWAFNRQVPGPTIRAREGERVRIVVTNALPEGTTAHWHGLEVPNDMDGVPGISQDPIPPGESFTYEFTAKPAGTRLYHSHFNALHQEEHGLYGMFIVEPRAEAPALRADREEIMILGDGPLGFVINGKEFPQTSPIDVRKGEKIRVRMANLGGLYHPMHLHGGHFDVVAKDGFTLQHPQRMNTISIAPGETFDVLLEAREPGTWLWHCHVLSHVTGPKNADGSPTVAGMVGIVRVEDGDTQTADRAHDRSR